MAVAIDIVVMLLIGGLALMGWRHGFLLTAITFGGVVLGYVGAYLLYEPVGTLLQEKFALQPVMAYGLGGALVFLAIMTVALITRLLVARRRDDEDPEFWDALGGAFIGALYGSGLAILMVGALNLMQAMGSNADLRVGNSLSARVAIPICTRITRAVVGRTSESDVLAETASKFVADPVETKRNLQSVFDDQRIQDMLRDPETVAALASGNLAKLHDNERLRELAHDPEFSVTARGAGLMADLDAEGSSVPATEQLAKSLSPMAKGVQVLAHDPEVQQLLQEPGLLETVRSGDVARMLGDPAFNRLAGIVLRKLRHSNNQ